MAINLANFEELAHEAVTYFWNTRNAATQAQSVRGTTDQAERASVTGGKNLDGFVELIEAIVLANGLTQFSIHRKKDLVTLPGFYRATKQWDLLVVHNGRLVVALELKSQIGPSFGNNFNNRCEEAIGTASDLWVAFRERAFNESPRPFVGYLMLLEDCNKVHTPIREVSPHFQIFEEFKETGYARRYEILCRKLVQERLYDSAALLLSPRDRGAIQGEYRELSETTGLKRFVAQLASRIAHEVAL